MKGFYRGLIPTLILVSNPAIQFMVYERMKVMLTTWRASGKMNSLDVFVLGAIAKLSASLATFPYLLVKSRLQAKGTTGVAKYAGFVDAVVTIMKHDGPLGFYRGIHTKLLQTVLGAAFMFWVKDNLVSYTLAFIRLLYFRKM